LPPLDYLLSEERMLSRGLSQIVGRIRQYPQRNVPDCCLGETTYSGTGPWHGYIVPQVASRNRAAT